MAYFIPEGVLKISGAALAGITGKEETPTTAAAVTTDFWRKFLRDGLPCSEFMDMEKPEALPPRHSKTTKAKNVFIFVSSWSLSSLNFIFELSKL